MKKGEWIFLGAVFVLAVLLAGASLGHFGDWIARSVRQASYGAGAAGKPREVDLHLIRRQIRQRRLSEREAKYYKRLSPLPKRNAGSDEKPGP